MFNNLIFKAMEKNFSFASKFNRVSFGIDTKDFKYIKLADLYATGGGDEIHPVNGMFVSTSPLGESGVIIDAPNKQLVNVPMHMTETLKSILADADAVDAIKNGKVGYVIHEYQSHGRNCYGLNFVDM